MVVVPPEPKRPDETWMSRRRVEAKPRQKIDMCFLLLEVDFLFVILQKKGCQTSPWLTPVFLFFVKRFSRTPTKRVTEFLKTRDDFLYGVRIYCKRVIHGESVYHGMRCEIVLLRVNRVRRSLSPSNGCFRLYPGRDIIKLVSGIKLIR